MLIGWIVLKVEGGRGQIDPTHVFHASEVKCSKL